MLPDPPAWTPAAERLEAETLAARVLAAPADVAAELGLVLVADGGAVGAFAGRVEVPAFNRIVGLGVGAPATEAQLGRLLGAARDCGARRCLVHLAPGHAPAALPAWIAAAGGRPFNRLVRLWRRTTDLPRATSALRVARIDVEGAAAFGETLVAAFGMPAAAGPWLAAAVGRAGWEHYGAYDGPTLVATGALYVSGGVGWLGMGSTGAEHRGRGAQSALIAHRLARAAAAGCEWVVTETAEETPEHPVPSYRNMRRLGFVDAYRRPSYLVVLDGADAAP